MRGDCDVSSLFGRCELFVHQGKAHARWHNPRYKEPSADIDHRAQRCGEVDPHPLHEQDPGADRRNGDGRRTGREGHQGEGARQEDGVRPLRGFRFISSDRGGHDTDGPQSAQRPPVQHGGGHEGGQGGPRAHGHRPARPPSFQRAVRGTASEGHAGEGPGPGARDPPPGRAHRQSRHPPPDGCDKDTEEARRPEAHHSHHDQP